MEGVFPEILLPIKKELDHVEHNVGREMRLKAGHVSDFTTLELHWWDKYLHPAALILSARMFGYHKPQVLTLATVVQFIHIATGIHYGQYDHRPGLPVLIGDYFYAKFFSYLCKGDVLEWLPEMANVICNSHAAGVREVEERQSAQLDLDSYINLLRKQSSLLGTCTAFGSLATGGTPEQEKALRAFGVNLGAAINLIKKNQYLSVAAQLLADAKKELDLFADSSPKRIFEHVLDVFQKGLQQNCLVG